MRARTHPPGPKERFPGEQILAFNRNPTGFLSRLVSDYGDVSYFRLGWFNVALVNHPALIQDVLVTHHRNFIQGLGYQKSKLVLSSGLLVSDGDVHLQRRRLMQPMFHRRHIQNFGTVIADLAAQACEQWQEGPTLDIAHAMRQLTLRITAKTLFSTSVEQEAEEFSQTVDDLAEMFTPLFLLFSDWLALFPNPLRRRFEAGSKKLDEKIYRLVREHQARGDQGDLLSLLLAAQVGTDGERALSDAEVRDEALEIFMAGHGTIAMSLSWTLYLLAQHPEVEAQLLAELERVLENRLPTIEDVSRLTYTRMVFTEALRLYPPVWIVDRQLIGDYELGGYCLPAGCAILLSPWAMHHDARFYADPLRFDPMRWVPDEVARRPQFAYFPFGGGVHLCIGESIAWIEGIMILATVLLRWRMHLESYPPVEMKPRTGLEPKNGIPMKLERRG